MLSVITTSVTMPSLCVTMVSVVILSLIDLGVVMITVTKLSVIKHNHNAMLMCVIMLNVILLIQCHYCKHCYTKYHCTLDLLC
jgi:hypothetical protein